MNTIAIIGGGASGLSAAISAASKKHNIIIIERKNRILRKLLATGNGRCNYTNYHASISRYHGTQIERIKPILDEYPPARIIDFFRSLGVESKVRENGRVYPLSEQASWVADALRLKASALGIKIITDFEVADISSASSCFKIISTSGEKIQADRIILAAGGKSSPDLGSNGSGYALASKLGHRVTELLPALVQLKTSKETVKGLQGIKTEALLTAEKNGVILAKERGDLLFTDNGISGNAVFYISWITALEKNIKFFADLLPDINEQELTDLLKSRQKKLIYLNGENFLSGLLNKKLGQMLLQKIKPGSLSSPVSSFSQEEIYNISKMVKRMPLNVTGTESFKTAQVTAGGVALCEINMDRLESLKIQKLFFAGEILDVYGECGGYNLHWAFASGLKAGKAASKL